MPSKSRSKDRITIVTTGELEGERAVGGILAKRLDMDVTQLAVNISVFLDQMGKVVAQTPDTVGKFHLAEIEVSAEITGKGQVVLCGVGGELGAGGGIRFVFRKATPSTLV